VAKPILGGRFDLLDLEVDPSTYVAIDPAGVILWHNRAWTDFALANGGADVPARFGPGASYVGAIPDVLRGFFERAFAESLASGRPFEHDYECSSDQLFRTFHLRAMPVRERGLMLEHALRVEKAHEGPGEEHHATRYVASDGLVHQCAHCRRVRRAGKETWDWVPAWTRSPPRHASHGLCKACYGFYWTR
jgi:hypothetical protein